MHQRALQSLAEPMKRLIVEAQPSEQPSNLVIITCRLGHVGVFRNRIDI